MIGINAAPVSSFTGVPGWETIGEQHLLIKYSKKLPPESTILEIGCEYGMSTSLFSKYSHKRTKIVSIDLDCSKAAQNLFEAELLFPVIFLEGDSRIIHGALRGDVDLLFIDGDHSYQGARLDLHNYGKFVTKRGSVIILHDVAGFDNKNPHPSHWDVARALNEWLSSHAHGKLFTVEEAVDSMVVLKKVK